MIKNQRSVTFLGVRFKSKVNVGVKQQWLLVLEDITDHVRNQFWKEMSELNDLMMVLIKNLRTTKGIHMKCIHYDNAGENKALEKPFKLEGMDISLNILCQKCHNEILGLSISLQCCMVEHML